MCSIIRLNIAPNDVMNITWIDDAEGKDDATGKGEDVIDDNISYQPMRFTCIHRTFKNNTW